MSKSNVSASVEELIQTLQDRAQHIREQLIGTYGYGPVHEFLAQFDRLHAEHVNAVRQGFFLRALDLVGQIHHLSYGNCVHENGAREFIDYARKPRTMALRASAVAPGLSDQGQQVMRIQQVYLTKFYVPEFPGDEHNNDHHFLHPPASPTAADGNDAAAYASILQQVVDAIRRQRDFEWQQAWQQPLALPSDPEHARILAAFREQGSRCPHCHELLSDFKVAGNKSRFYICGACRRSFDKPEG